MTNFLVDHALKNVWCNPKQDNQVVFQLARICRDGGSFQTQEVLWRTVNLPDVKSRWYVYQIGALHPIVLGLKENVGVWVSFTDACNNYDMLINIYSLKGVEFPRFDTFYQYTYDGNLIVAIRRNDKINIDLNTEDVFVRFYRDAFYESPNEFGGNVSDRTYTNGQLIARNDDITQLQNLITGTYSVLPGYVVCYVNGHYVDNISLITAKVGDYCEFVFDSSLKKKIEFTVGDLDYFESTLDSSFKYLLHYNDPSATTIDYVDDIEAYITTRALGLNSIPYSTGVYYHHNTPPNMRMVTHKDYSVPVGVVDAYIAYLKLLVSNDNLTNSQVKITLLIKKSGYGDRPLVYENNRIHEMYKLSDADVYEALIGNTRVNPYWTAANLEQSSYATIMRSNCDDVTVSMVESGYGYNAASKAIGDTPIRVTNVDFSVVLPYVYSVNSTVFEYDMNGKLLGYSYHAHGSTHQCVYPNVSFIEAFSGHGTSSVDDSFTTHSIGLPAGSSYQVYFCELNNGLPDLQWRHTTLGDDLYSIDSNTLTWFSQEYDPYICVRTNSKFLLYENDYVVQNGIIEFDLVQEVQASNGIAPAVMQIPMGNLDLFMEGYSLIPGIDYTLKFPKVVIHSKKLLNDNKTSYHFVIRYTDFCDSSLNTNIDYETGFIKHGLLSMNHRYLIKDDKVQRAVVGGGVVFETDYLFAENSNQVSSVNPHNGKPYSVRDVLVTTKNILPTDTLILKDQSSVIDKAITDYMTLYYPQTDRNAVSTIAVKYPMFSPFISRIIAELQKPDSDLVASIPTMMYDDASARTMVSDYFYLLDFDPVTNINLDTESVFIHPHHLQTRVSLGVKEYMFIKRIVGMYCNGLVDISQEVTIST